MKFLLKGCVFATIVRTIRDKLSDFRYEKFGYGCEACIIQNKANNLRREYVEKKHNYPSTFGHSPMLSKPQSSSPDDNFEENVLVPKKFLILTYFFGLYDEHSGSLVITAFLGS